MEGGMSISSPNTTGILVDAVVYYLLMVIIISLKLIIISGGINSWVWILLGVVFGNEARRKLLIFGLRYMVVPLAEYDDASEFIPSHPSNQEVWFSRQHSQVTSVVVSRSLLDAY
jgi:hypothetical protein